jgi:hypothetical protein
MSKIAMETRGKRPRFFPAAGTDETVTILLELAAELWTVKERLYALERAADDAGLDLTDRIEAWKPTEEQGAELDAARAQMIGTLFRSLEARHVPGTHLRRALDAKAATSREEEAVIEEEVPPIRAA